MNGFHCRNKMVVVIDGMYIGSLFFNVGNIKAW